MSLWKWLKCFTGSIDRPIQQPAETAVARGRPDPLEHRQPSQTGHLLGSFQGKQLLWKWKWKIFMTLIPPLAEI
jgi:hypothetical protein